MIPKCHYLCASRHTAVDSRICCYVLLCLQSSSSDTEIGENNKDNATYSADPESSEDRRRRKSPPALLAAPRRWYTVAYTFSYFHFLQASSADEGHHTILSCSCHAISLQHREFQCVHNKLNHQTSVSFVIAQHFPRIIVQNGFYRQLYWSIRFDQLLLEN